MEKVRATEAQIEALRMQQREIGEAAFKEGAAGLFAKHGEIFQGFRWQQYTPYFNDGDPCQFGANTDALGFLIEGEWCDWYDNPIYAKRRESIGYGANAEPNPAYDPALAQAVEDARDFLRVWPTELLEALFGDHAEVSVTPAGVDVAEYEHE